MSLAALVAIETQRSTLTAVSASSGLRSVTETYLQGKWGCIRECVRARVCVCVCACVRVCVYVCV